MLNEMNAKPICLSLCVHIFVCHQVLWTYITGRRPWLWVSASVRRRRPAWGRGPASSRQEWPPCPTSRRRRRRRRRRGRRPTRRRPPPPLPLRPTADPLVLKRLKDQIRPTQKLSNNTIQHKKKICWRLSGPVLNLIPVDRCRWTSS